MPSQHARPCVSVLVAVGPTGGPEHLVVGAGADPHRLDRLADRHDCGEDFGATDPFLGYCAAMSRRSISTPAVQPTAASHKQRKHAGQVNKILGGTCGCVGCVR